MELISNVIKSARDLCRIVDSDAGFLRVAGYSRIMSQIEHMKKAINELDAATQDHSNSKVQVDRYPDGRL